MTTPVSRFHAGLIAVVALGLAAGLAWIAAENARLRTEIARQSEPGTANLAQLRQQLDAQSRRVAAAEASVARLLDAAKAAKAVAATRSASGASAAPSIDAEEAARATVAKARDLIKAGRYQEALDEFLAAYQEQRALLPGGLGTQILMGEMKLLGRKYPAALAALAGLRDTAVAQWQEHPEQKNVTSEIAQLNERLGEGSRTLAIYDTLPTDDHQRQSLAMIAFSSFVEAQRYEDALVGRPYGQMLGVLEAGTAHLQQPLPGNIDPALRRNALASLTATDIEVLTGAGRAAEAKTLTEKLLAMDNSPQTQALLAQHVARAQTKP